VDLLRGSANSLSGYGGGNLINLCVNLGIDLTNYDFSNLKISHAYLQKVNLYQINFSNCNLDKSVFTQTLKGVVSVAFTPDGTLLATGDTSPEVQLWQVAYGQPFLLLQGHNNLVLVSSLES
jgi:WD40 repeat protein